jgi:predicted nucleic acid-binding protein
MKRVLLDSGPIVAILSRRDQYHKVCVEALKEMPGPLFTCWPVLTEAAWLLRRDSNAVQKLLNSLETGFLELLNLTHRRRQAHRRNSEEVSRQGIQLADAALVHLAARDGLDTIFTLDPRDFSVYRLPKGRTFRVLPTGV